MSLAVGCNWPPAHRRRALTGTGSCGAPTIPGWNQLVEWLRELDLLRRAYPGRSAFKPCCAGPRPLPFCVWRTSRRTLNRSSAFSKASFRIWQLREFVPPRRSSSVPTRGVSDSTHRTVKDCGSLPAPVVSSGICARHRTCSTFKRLSGWSARTLAVVISECCRRAWVSYGAGSLRTSRVRTFTPQGQPTILDTDLLAFRRPAIAEQAGPRTPTASLGTVKPALRDLDGVCRSGLVQFPGAQSTAAGAPIARRATGARA